MLLRKFNLPGYDKKRTFCANKTRAHIITRQSTLARAIKLLRVRIGESPCVHRALRLSLRGMTCLPIWQ